MPRLLPVSTALLLSFSAVFFTHTYADATASINSNYLSAERDQKQVTRQVAGLLDRTHYLQKPFDDSISKETLKLYIDSLDPNRSIFLQSDIDQFEANYATTLDDQLKQGDLSGAFAIYARYQERSEAYYAYADRFLAEGSIDLNTNETLQTDRTEAPYVKNQAALTDLWRKQLVSQLINITLGQQEEKAREEIFRENPELAQGQDLIRDDKRTPEEILANRLDRQKGRLMREKNDDVLQRILNAALASYDPHSSYFAPVQATEYNLRSNLSLEGIGVSIRADRKNPDYTRIESVVEGGPAQKTGRVKAGEFIIGVTQANGDYNNVVGWSLTEIVGLIRGKRGTEVTISLLQPGAPESSARTVTITRDVIEQDESGVQSRVVEIDKQGVKHRVGVLEIPSFYLNARAKREGEDYRSVSEDTLTALNSLKEQNIEGLVVDLRNNPGGSLDEVARMLSFFIKEGSLVQIRDSRGNVQVFKDVDGGEQVYAGPLTVLINLASASASEIFAAAIQDYNRGIVVGSTTTGKGSAQLQLNTIAYGQMTLTQRKFYRVTGGSTQNKGVVPDIEFVNIYDDDLGERALINPMDWDTIRTAPYRPEPSFDARLSPLKAESDARRQSNPEFVYLNELKNQQLEEKEDEKTVKLSINERRQRVDQIEARTLEIENKRRSAKGIDPYQSWEEYQADREVEAEIRSRLKSNERPPLPEDEAFIDEAALILLDFIEGDKA